jgi:hypothetical protein
MKSFALYSKMLEENLSTTFVRTLKERNTWAIGNALVERLIGFDPGIGLSTLSWQHRVTGTDFVANAVKPHPKSNEYSVWADQEHFAGTGQSAWKLGDVHTEKLA